MEQKLKLGDRVRVIDHRPSDQSGFPTWNPKMDETLGQEGEIFETWFVPDVFSVKFPNGRVWNFKRSWLMLVESADKPNPPFKPGDRVRLNPDAGVPLRLRALAHEILVVEEYDKSDNTVKVGDDWLFARWLEHVEDETHYSLSSPLRAIGMSTAELISSMFVSRQPQSISKLPLINTNRLLTTIKLD